MTVWNKTGNSSFTKITSIFNKTGSTTWTEILGVWVKTASSTWTRVFTRILVPANTVPPSVTGSQYLYGTLTGTLGTWTSPNGTNSYSRQWQRSTPSGTPIAPVSWGNISGATSSTYTTVDADNGKYIRLNVTANNLSPDSSTAASYETLITKYSPVALSLYSLTGSSIVGATLTALEQIGTWKQTTTNSGDTYPDTFEYEWSYSDGTIIQSTAFNSINSNTYTIVTGDLGKIIRVRVTGRTSAYLDDPNRGSGYATTGYTSSSTITSVYAFNFGNTLYVGSNGYIGLDNGGSTAASPGSGRNINIYSSDLVQYKLQEYSDASNYYLYFRSYNYQSPLVRAAANAVDYQIKFYTGQPYCDIYIVRRGASVPTQTQGPGYYSSGFTGYAGIPGPYVWSAGSVLRVYFNGTTSSQSALTWTTISDSVWKDITNADIDDSFTSVVTSANQQAAILTAPTITSVSSTKENQPVSAYFTGGSGPYYQIYWTTGLAPGSGFTPDAEGSSSPLIDSSGPATTGYTYYMYVRSVSALGYTLVGPASSLASAWSAGYSFTVQSANLIAPTISSVTAGPQGGAVSVAFTGGSGPFYQAYWYASATAPAGSVTPDATGSSSPLTDSTGPSSTATQYMYVRSVLTSGETSVGPSTLASAWSAGVSFNMTSTAVSQSIAPTAKATSNNSTTTVKYGDSITWAAGTYTNAASITSVLLYSTNTSNLVSTGGDTSTSTRTTNPYVISTNDPTGTPYVFAVRDTVVGTNGTTYYFYSNQITSALADAVAFSYNAGVSAAGGWSATVVTAQSGATYSINATTGYSVNSSTGTVTVTGLGSNVSSSITVTKSVAGTNNTTASASGTSNTVVASYTITYNGNGNTGGSTTATTGNGSVTLRANGFTRTNASFAGWNTASDGTGTSYAASTSYTLSADVTLYATWTANTVTFTNPTVTFIGNSGSGSTSTKSWSWTAGSVSGATANGYEWSISSTSSTSGFGAFTATSVTSLTLTVANASTNPRWLKVRKVGTDGLGAKVVSGTNNGV